MTLDTIVDWAFGLYHTYTVFVLLFIAVLALITIINPKPMFRFYLFVSFMAAALYLLSYVADSVSTGTGSKKVLSTKSSQAIE